MYMQSSFILLVCISSLSVTAQNIVLMWPIEEGKFWISSYYGPRKKPNGQSSFHNGIDMAACKGTRVQSSANGVIELACEESGYGKMIIIKHENNCKTRYAHLDKILVVKGQRVVQGELIGRVGSTGNVRSTGKDPSHLHFEVYHNNERVNPMQFLKKEKQ